MPNWDTWIRRGHPVLFAVLIIFSIVELGISAWLTGRFDARHNFLSTSVRDKVEFILFASCWTLFFSLIFFAVFLYSPEAGFVSSILAHVIFMVLTWVFWLSGAAALSAAFGGRLNCSHHFIYCGQLNTVEAFAWMLWVVSTFGLVVIFMRAIQASRRGDGAKGPLVG